MENKYQQEIYIVNHKIEDDEELDHLLEVQEKIVEFEFEGEKEIEIAVYRFVGTIKAKQKIETTGLDKDLLI